MKCFIHNELSGIYDTYTEVNMDDQNGLKKKTKNSNKKKKKS